MVLSKDMFVRSRDRGVVKISDAVEGEYVLCRGINDENTYSPISYKKEVVADCFNIITNTGSNLIIGTSSNLYKNNDIIRDKTSYVLTPLKEEMDSSKQISKDDIGWFLGCHTGDGTCDKRGNYYRLRIVGDNENVISEYSKVANFLTSSNANYSLSTKYKCSVWSYVVSNTKIKPFVDEYFDGVIGEKTHNGKIYSYIKNNNLLIPYLAGLMDSDGTVKRNGTIEIMMCMTSVINELCILLSSLGIRYHYAYKKSVRQNEKPIHRLTIYLNEPIVMEIIKHMRHNVKIENIQKGDSNRFVGNYFPITTSIFERIKNYKPKYKMPFYTNCIYYRKFVTENKTWSSGIIRKFFDVGVITSDEYYNFMRYVGIKITEDLYNVECCDIKTYVGNIYCGEFGLINVEELKL